MIVLIILTIISALVYYGFLIIILSGLKNSEIFVGSNNKLEKVTVIIPFRNEEQVIARCYDSVLKQNYPQDLLEILFIDDSSEDNSYEILNQLERPTNIKLLKVPSTNADRAFKKRVIEFGIEQSSGDIIITTDADCIHKENWISSIVRNFCDDTAIVSGPVYFNNNGSLFGRLQTIEFASLVIVGAGLIGSGNPTICSAANLAYRKKVFYEVDGYNDNKNLSSGDDELLLQKIARLNKYKIKFSYSDDSVVYTGANEEISTFLNQRKRWASKSLYYSNFLLILSLVFIMLYYISIPTLMIAGIFFSPIFLPYFFLSIIIKFLLEYFIMNEGRKKIFKELDLSLFLIAEAVHLPYIIISGISGLFGNFEWKGRKVKR